MQQSQIECQSRLRLWRTREGLTLAEVAGLSGLSIGVLSKVERGQRRLLPLNRIMLARALGVAVSELFEPDYEIEAGEA